MRRIACLLAVLGAVAPLRAADGAPAGPTASAPSSSPVSPLVAASRAARAAREAAAGRPEARRVWTIEDLEALKAGHEAHVNVLDIPGSSLITTSATTGLQQAGPAGVAARYRELLAQADGEIEKLQRERLAGTNPLLRGMGGETPRPIPEIDAELAKWKDRRDVASRYVGDAP